MEGSVQRITLANSRAFFTYSSAERAPICHSPYISLPRPQYLTPNGSSCPFWRLRFAQ